MSDLFAMKTHRYHIVAKLNKALGQVRSSESRQRKSEGWDILKGSRWLLRRRKRLDGKKRWPLRQLMQWDLKTMRAFILVDMFEQLWSYKSPTYVAIFWIHGVVMSYEADLIRSSEWLGVCENIDR